MKRSKIRLLILYDATMVRYALTLALARNSGFEISHCHSVDEMVAHVSSQPTDVILLGYNPGEKPPLQSILNATKVIPPDVKVMVLASHLNDLTAWLLAHAGVRGVLLKAITLEALADSIRTVHKGGTCIEPCFTEAIRRYEDSPSLGKLTPREHETLGAVANGFTNKEIAQHLGITESGIKSVVQRLFRKMGAENRTHLLRITLERHPEPG